jgi:molecular chaperone HscA
MDRAVERAIAGKAVDSIEEGVADARGVDAHVAEHAERAAARGGE